MSPSRFSARATITMSPVSWASARARMTAVRASPSSPCVYRIAPRAEERSRFDSRRKGGPFQDLVIPPDPLGRMPADAPEEEQTPRDVGCFGGAVAIDEPGQCAAVALEIVTHAIQPLALRRADQPLRGQGGFRGAIAHQPLHGVVALARRGELERRVRTYGFEHLVQRTSSPLSSRLAAGGFCPSGPPPRGARRRSSPEDHHDRQPPPRRPRSETAPAARRDDGRRAARGPGVDNSRRPSH